MRNFPATALLSLLACTAPKQDTGTNEPEYNIMLMHGDLPPETGCWVVYFDKATYEMHVTLGVISNEGTTFCVTKE